MKKLTKIVAIASVALPSMALAQYEGGAGPTGDPSNLPIGVLTNGVGVQMSGGGMYVVSSDNFTGYITAGGETIDCTENLADCRDAFRRDEQPEDPPKEEEPEQPPEGEEPDVKEPKKKKKKKDKSEVQLDAAACDTYTRGPRGEICAIFDDSVSVEASKYWNSTGLLWVCEQEQDCYFADFFTNAHRSNFTSLIVAAAPGLFYKSR